MGARSLAEHKEAVMDSEWRPDAPDTSRMTKAEFVAQMTKAIAALKADARAAG